MNKPAAKEPSMDEILSSIRQIIADDDAGAPPMPSAADADDTAEEDISFDIPGEFDVPEASEEEAEEPEALALSEEQIVEDAGAEGEDEDEGFDIPDLSMGDEDASGEDAEADQGDGEDDFQVPELVVPDDIAFDEDAAQQSTVAQESAPMPDAGLSDEIADSLLEPATDAAVKNAFAKLGNISLGAGNLTLENMVREMLRPMLKEWLDENLPSVVEKMVEKEIERLSRGG